MLNNVTENARASDYVYERSNIGVIALARIGVFPARMCSLSKSVPSVESAAPRGILSLSANMFYSSVAGRGVAIGSNIGMDQKEEGRDRDRECERKRKKERERRRRRVLD